MSKPVAIVSGASQGMGSATAVRLARDFGFVVAQSGQARRNRGSREGGRRRSPGHRRRLVRARSRKDEQRVNTSERGECLLHDLTDAHPVAQCMASN